MPSCDTLVWVFLNTLIWVFVNTLVWVLIDTLVWVLTAHNGYPFAKVANMSETPSQIPDFFTIISPLAYLAMANRRFSSKIITECEENRIQLFDCQ